MTTKIASIYSDDDPDSCKRYINWERHTLYTDGSVTLEGGRCDSDLWGISATADEVDSVRQLKWSNLSKDVQEALRQDAINNNKLPEFELAITD